VKQYQTALRSLSGLKKGTKKEKKKNKKQNNHLPLPRQLISPPCERKPTFPTYF
jgi:hypothetical protein